MNLKQLQSMASAIQSCDQCPLAAERTLTVPGEGSCTKGIMLIGEAPGEKEDLSGLPFHGRTGAFLDRIFAELGLTRQDFFITSAVKCRPPGNRNPHTGELSTCREQWLLPQIEAVAPSRIVLLGLMAARSMLGNAAKGVSLAALREQEHNGPGETVCNVTYHPSAGMRFPKFAQALRDDLARFSKMS